MILLLSGEGASDIGSDGGCATIPCEPSYFTPGPLARLLAQLLNHTLSSAGLDDAITFGADAVVPARMISKVNLSGFPHPNPRLKLRAADEPKDALAYKVWAAKLAQCALQLAQDQRDHVLAIFFHDADGTNTSPRSLWDDKYMMISRGFQLTTQGAPPQTVACVAMLAKPKSEAWLLCALRPTNKYQSCAALEDESGNDASPSSLKAQLARALNVPAATTAALLDAIDAGQIDASQIDMPSINQLRHDLRLALDSLGYPNIPEDTAGPERPRHIETTQEQT